MDLSGRKLSPQILIIICQTLGIQVLDLFTSRFSNQLELCRLQFSSIESRGWQSSNQIDPRGICIPFYQSKSTFVWAKSASFSNFTLISVDLRYVTFLCLCFKVEFCFLYVDTLISRIMAENNFVNLLKFEGESTGW